MYAYCLNNPVNMYDPVGEFAFLAVLGGTAAWKVGAAIVGVICTVLIADTLTKNPLTLPSFSMPVLHSASNSEDIATDAATSTYQDKPGHVRVAPVIGTLADWRAGGSNHPCTIAVRSVVVKWDGGN